MKYVSWENFKNVFLWRIKIAINIYMLKKLWENKFIISLYMKR